MNDPKDEPEIMEYIVMQSSSRKESEWAIGQAYRSHAANEAARQTAEERREQTRALWAKLQAKRKRRDTMAKYATAALIIFAMFVVAKSFGYV